MNHKYSYNSLVVFEGVDGAGKSTQISLLEQYLRNKGKKVVKIHCPDYDYYSGMLIKDMLYGSISSNPDDVNLYATSLMYSIDRYMVVNKSYREYFLDSEDYYILMDRYTQSNLIHQGAKLIKNEVKWETTKSVLEYYGEWLYNIEYSKIGLPEPDKVIYLSIPANESLNRVVSRGNPDIHESKDFISRSIQSGDFYSRHYKWDIVDCYDSVNNRSKSVEEVHKTILSRLKEVIEI